MLNGTRWLLVLLIAGVVIFARGLGIEYYADDFQFVYAHPIPGPLHFFFHEVPNNAFYRPLQASFIAVVQRTADLNTTPIHLTQLLMHVALCWLVYVAILRLGFARSQAVLGSLFMLIAQVNVHAVMSNDTLSQAGAALFGSASLLVLYLAGGGGPGPAQDARPPAWSAAGYALSLGLLALALLSKESGTAYLPLLLAVLVIVERRSHGRVRLAPILARFAPFLAVTILYLLLRSSVVDSQLTFGPDRYQLHLGLNVIQNLMMFFAAAAVPFSTADVFTHVAEKNLFWLGAVGSITFILLTLVAYGMWYLRRSWKLFVVLSIFAVAALFPTFLLNRTSELYVYNAMPFFAFVVGTGVGSALMASRDLRVLRLAVSLMIVVIFAGHFTAVQSKLSLMKQNW
jgi:hypothetical protein